MMDVGWMLIFVRVFKNSHLTNISEGYVFSWQLIHARLPTRSNLFRRVVLVDFVSSNCVWCMGF